MGSLTAPPRHWRRKAKAARERGRRVRRRRSFEVKEVDWGEGWGLIGAYRPPAIVERERDQREIGLERVFKRDENEIYDSGMKCLNVRRLFWFGTSFPNYLMRGP